jgi:hypothetical protein
LSYSSHSFTPRGASPKKERKRKQEFHKHKIKLSEENHTDFSTLKERMTLALEKLGNQKFSPEPGGYSFSNWLTSFNMLLDDFEQKVGTGNLPKDYYDSRQRLTAELLKPIDTSEIDAEIGKAESEIVSMEFEIARLTGELSSNRERERKANSEVNALKRERADSEKELVNAIKDLDAAKKKQKLFARLFSGKGNDQIDSAKSRVDSIVEEQKNIDKKALELERSSGPSDNDLENRITLLRQKLADLRYGLAEWVENKQQMLQLSEMRIATTSELSKEIASLDGAMKNENSSDSVQ